MRAADLAPWAPLQAATSAPLIERSIERATGIVYNITGGKDLTLQASLPCSAQPALNLASWMLVLVGAQLRFAPRASLPGDRVSSCSRHHSGPAIAAPALVTAGGRDTAQTCMEQA